MIFRYTILFFSLWSIYSCQTNPVSEPVIDDVNALDGIQQELDAYQDVISVLHEVTKISRSTFDYINKEINLGDNLSDPSLSTRNDCPTASKTRAEVLEELEQDGSSRFNVHFEPSCMINDQVLDFDGSLQFLLEGPLFEEGSTITVSVLDQFTAHQGNDSKLVFNGGKVIYEYVDLPGKSSFKTYVNNIIAQKEREFVETIFNLRSIDEGFTVFDEGAWRNDPNDLGSFLDDTAVFSFDAGVLERSDVEGVPRLDAIILPSELEFGVLCPCPINGTLGIQVNTTVFDTDYSERRLDCSASTRLTVTADGAVIGENIEGAQTFLPCDQ